MRASAQALCARLALASLLLLAAAPSSVRGFRVCLNMNQFARSMWRRRNAWAQLYSRVDCLFGPGAGNPELPMNQTELLSFMSLFDGKPKYYIVPYHDWLDKSYMTRQQFIDSSFWASHFRPTEFFTWGPGAELLSMDQLDAIQAAGFGSVFVNIHDWKINNSIYDPEAVKAIIRHPMVKGVVIEAPALALYSPGIKLNSQLQIAQYVLSINKPVSFLMYSQNTPDGLQDRINYMLNSLWTNLGTQAMCSDMVTLVPGAYNVLHNNVPFLPERDENGTLINTYASGALRMTLEKGARC